MDSFWLTFHDPVLERQYNQHVVDRAMASLDWYFIVAASASMIVGSLRFGFAWTVRVYLAWLACEAYIRWRFSDAGRRKWRVALVATSRCVAPP